MRKNKIPSKTKEELCRSRLRAFVYHARKLKYTIIMETLAELTVTKEVEGEIIIIKITLLELSCTTTLTHPKKGKTQLRREGLRMNNIKSILTNPRAHMSKEIKSTYVK